MMRKLSSVLLLLILCVVAYSSGYADDSGVSYESVPAVIRPGKLYNIVIHSNESTTLSLALLNEQDEIVYEIYKDFPLVEGANHLHWDGLRPDYSIVESGEYSIHLKTTSETIVQPLRIGAPYPLIKYIQQNNTTIVDTPLEISLEASGAGVLAVSIRDIATQTTTSLPNVQTSAGPNAFSWDGTVNNTRVPDGQYAISLLLRTDNGAESMPHQIFVEVVSESVNDDAVPEYAIDTEDEQTLTENNPEASLITEETEMAVNNIETEAPAEIADQKSPPYSSVPDDSFWGMTPGETDDAAIWEVLMQPITVYDGGIDQKEHVYLMENEDGSGKKLAQVHAQSQGLHVIGEVNQHGYVLVETFSAYDNSDFKPKTDEEKAHAFELKQGYVKAKGLKTVEVHKDYALVIDKMAQRMYIYINGERATELLICTGKIINEEYYRETPPGEFITVSHVGPFSTNKYMKSEMAIRISGGILIHELPHEPLADGSKRYADYEALLGTKASAGCIRVQRKENEDGYNQSWIWENFKRGEPYKVIIWDDDASRVDNPVTQYPNPS